ncbi:uncharacterized protein LOC142354024 [Convolutriloba macropyga]|uniref:uncharacterized protein LOC142354024 n=1 Tax=Convolutriloba macropyga TaxID=536237 RepID=UPI003F51E4F4
MLHKTRNHVRINHFENGLLSPKTDMIRTQVQFNESACLYVITEIGFGAPPLMQFPGSTSGHGIHLPYVLPPQPGLRPLTFTFQQLRTQLTFGWFKWNIMCRDQPWICQ